MMRFRSVQKIYLLFFLILCFHMLAVDREAQADPFAQLFQSVPLLGRAVESDFPGATLSKYPFLHMPQIGGEVRVTWLSYNMINGKFLFPERGIALDLKDDLLFPHNVSAVEFAGRLQLARYSLRAVYDAYMRAYRGSGYLYWPELRIGADVDVFKRDTWRLGVNLDFTTNYPTLSVTDPILGPFQVVGQRPVTFGVHGWYNPRFTCGISPVVEARYRWPIQTGTKMYEFEVAGGLKLPDTILGCSAVRAGWRHTATEFSSAGQTADVTLSGVFAEYVFYY
ncbi:hypothetical protein [Desulfomonile tiedjei]|uniref:Uncharacterized protein n=1 Tax=Desulfomonile tiedjei (strain ATCC 49306 / DSM 6799 / DCB-1) TaxID=706587 RepID=I4CD72_DESTA|nr:hypothetical protein [Desulfomonile tiedjei]AFM27513.1 hypothetical protein Desti_4899 [Desulfomonile tiedjei DSM 6799]